MRSVTTQIGVRVRLLPPQAAARLEVHLPSSSVLPPLQVPLSAPERAALAEALETRREATVGPVTLRHYTDAPPQVAFALDVTAGPQRSRCVQLTPDEACQLAALLREDAAPGDPA